MASEAPPDKSWIESPPSSKAPGTASVTLDAEQIEAIGLKTVPVKTQTEPTVLRLFGVDRLRPGDA